MVGDGCGLGPLEPRLLAPISGVISQLHRNKHAVAIHHASGLELLLHLGLETVSLEGQGIWPKVMIDQEVEAGQTLMEFDVDLLASQVRSLISALVITNSEQVIDWRYAQPGLVDQGQVLFSCQVAQTPEPNRSTQGTLNCAEVRLPNPQGIHARPAAVLSQAIKELGAEAWLIKDQQRAKAINRVRTERQQASSRPNSPIPKPFVALQILDQRLAYLNRLNYTRKPQPQGIAVKKFL